MSFEKNIIRLDEIVKSLERGDAPLSESLKLFEEGTGLIKSCSKMLDEAEQKVVVLTREEDGTLSEKSIKEEVQ
ncbi:MAG: exodeoxyribonuclease VII small subunit [Clostridia bacterium]